MSTNNPYITGLDKNPANYAPLTPLSFIERSAYVYPEHLAIVHGQRRYTWADLYNRSRQLASALQKRGIGFGDTVAVMATNTPEAYELHFGVPMLGAVLNMLNIRLDADMIAFMLQHGEAKVLITDREFSPTIKATLAQLENPITVIDIDDPEYTGEGELLGEKNYEALLEEGTSDFAWKPPEDEWQAISLNYTSGTTGNPKGVVYHHRGAYLNAISNIMNWGMPKHPVYLWTLPMFHCNGWCFPWSLAAAVGTSVCLRRVEVDAIYHALAYEQVTHYCGAPIVHNMLINAPDEVRQQKQNTVKGLVAAAAPPAALLEGMEKNNFDITHVYGLTETYGPAVVCEKHTAWDNLPIEEKAEQNARQGVRYHMLEGLMVADPATLEPVPWDGETLGEIFMRGNVVMMGYLKNTKATEAAFRGGWFHSGDLGVMHPDGYIQIKDRSKDIIISGGENISTLEVESVLYRHPAVLEAAVVARPDEKWGEVPCAFIALKNNSAPITEAEIIEFCRSNMAHYKVPKKIIFTNLPKTSTGKIQKYVLREKAKAAG